MNNDIENENIFCKHVCQCEKENNFLILAKSSISVRRKEI